MAPFKPYGTPPSFDLDEYKDNFELWKEQWDVYIALSTIDTELPQNDRPAYKANLLKHSLSKSTFQALLRSGLTAAQLLDPDVIINTLKQRCNSGRNVHVWRQRFQLRVQRPNENLDDWLCDLRDLATKADFATGCCANSEKARLLQQLIFGAEDDDDRRRLLEKGSTLTLDQAIDFLRASENARKDSSGLRGAEAPSVQQAAKSNYKKQKTSKADARSNSKSGQTSKKSAGGGHPNDSKCIWCGAEKKHTRKECPADEKECNKCHKIGHFGSVCLSTAGKQTPCEKRLQTILVATTKSSQLAAVTASEMVNITIKAQGGPAATIPFLPDTGAELDAIPPAIFHRSFKSIRLQPADNPVTAVGSAIQNDGSFSATLDWSADDGTSRPVAVTVHVLRGLKQPVLSRFTQRKLGMLPADYPHTRVNQIDAEQPVTGAAGRRSTLPSTDDSSPPSPPPLFPNLMARTLPVPEAISSINPSPSAEKMKDDLQKLVTEFPAIFDGICRPMKGPPCHFELKEGATPIAMRGSRPVSVPLMPRLKEELDSLLEQGVIRKVDSPTAWIHPIVIEPKPCGGLRLCVDFRALNKHIVRPRFESQTPFQAVRTIPKGMKFFTVIDALKGYHQVQLDEESAALTTFSTPFGRFQYLRLPFGIVHAGDDYGRRVSEVFDDLPNSRRVVEDVLVFSATYSEHVKLVRELLRRADEHQVSINARKMQFAQPSAKFGGFILDGDGFRPDPELVRAIAEFPVPLNITDLRSFFGLCQQVGHFSDQISSALIPLAPLLKSGFAWEWTSVHDGAFRRAREALSNTKCLAFYDPALPTALHVDASRLNGLGFLLKQKGADGHWRLVQAGSRFLSSAESRYAMIELECLAAAWAMFKCRQFLEGLPTFDLITDHRPLVPILNEYALDKLDNPRLLRLRLKMQRFSVSAKWIAGKANKDADALSRAPVGQPSPGDELGEGAPFQPARLSLLCAIERSDAKVLDPILEKVKAAALIDPVMQELRDTIIRGFPNEKCNLPYSLRPFWKVREQLAIDDTDDMVVVGSRVVIPKALQRDVLKDLLLMHQGATKLRQRARMSIYWPDVDLLAEYRCRDRQRRPFLREMHQLPSIPSARASSST